MSTILPHMMSSWCEFRMQVWNALWLAENTRHKYHQKFAICAPSHTFYRPYLCNQGIYRRCRKNLLNSNIASTCSHNMVNFGSLAADITLPVWGTPDIVLRRSTKLCTMFGRLLGCYIYIFGGSCPLMEFYQVQNSLCPNLAFYIGGISARHSSSLHQPKFAAFSTGHHLYSAGQPSRWASAHILVVSV